MVSVAHKEENTSNIKSLEPSKNSTAKERTARLQLALPESSFLRLEAIKEATEAASFAEVVRRSLRLYEGLIAETADGASLIVKREDGSEEIVPVYRAL